MGNPTRRPSKRFWASPSFQNRRIEGGLRYVAESGNSITFMQRSIPADLINQALDPNNLIDTNYTDTESDLKVSWKNGGKSTLDGNVTYKNAHERALCRSAILPAPPASFVTGGRRPASCSSTLAAVRTFLPYFAYGNTIENSNNEGGPNVFAGIGAEGRRQSHVAC